MNAHSKKQKRGYQVNNIIKPFVIRGLTLLLHNLAGYRIFELTTSALIIFTAFSLLAYMLAELLENPNAKIQQLATIDRLLGSFNSKAQE